MRNNTNKITYHKALTRTGKTIIVPSVAPMIAHDGWIMFTSEEVANATPTELQEMREKLHDYNSER